HLWLVPEEGGAARLLASHTDGFAVSADGAEIAYATLNSGGTRSVLWRYPLDPGFKGLVAGTHLDQYAKVAGFSGDQVLIQMARIDAPGVEGRPVVAACCDPGGHVSTLPGFGSVIASDQTSRLALMTQSGSTCAQIVDVSALTVLKELGSCGTAQA